MHVRVSLQSHSRWEGHAGAGAGAVRYAHRHKGRCYVGMALQAGYESQGGRGVTQSSGRNVWPPATLRQVEGCT